MAVPDAIQKQADKAEALQKQLASATPVEVVSDLPKVVNVNPDSEFVSAEPGEAPGQVAKPAEPSPDPLLQAGDTWEHKYSVLQGKYNSDLTELRAELESQAGTIANLNSLIVSLNNAPGTPMADPSNEVRPQAGHEELDPTKFEGYGSEMLDLVKLVKQQASEISLLKGETDKLTENQVKSDADVYYDALDLKVGDWRTLNKDPGFLAWLKEPDGLSNTPRQENMTAAHTAMDVKAVCKYFLAYKENGNNPLKPTTPNPPPSLPQNTLLSQVVPFDTGVKTEITQPEGGQPAIVSRAQFNQAVNQRVKGKITEEQFKLISDNFQRSIGAGQV